MDVHRIWPEGVRGITFPRVDGSTIWRGFAYRGGMSKGSGRIDAVFFCRQIGRERGVDEMYAEEAREASAAGLVVNLVDHDAAAAGEFDRAVRAIDADGRGRRFVYRGWMLKVPAYRGLIGALEGRRWCATTSPEDYEACHHLPGWAGDLAELSPRSAWIPHDPPFETWELTELLEKFDGPVMVKDYVKSEKQAWNEACFIPDSRDRERAIKVITRFVELRESNFEGGLVIREFVRLVPNGVDGRSGMPLSKELRSFWRGTTCVAITDYWHHHDCQSVPPIAQEAAQRINRPFYTIDLAMTIEGEWLVIEVGDGQVSALPESLSPRQFYSALVAAE